jgi:hypothetical protein
MGVGQNGMIGTPQQAEVIILIRKYLCVLRELCTFRSTVRAWLVEVDFTMTQRAGTVRGSMGIGLHRSSLLSTVDTNAKVSQARVPPNSPLLPL